VGHCSCALISASLVPADEHPQHLEDAAWPLRVRLQNAYNDAFAGKDSDGPVSVLRSRRPDARVWPWSFDEGSGSRRALIGAEQGADRAGRRGLASAARRRLFAGHGGLGQKRHDIRPIQGWLGHRPITSAVYTTLAPNRFKDFWRD
jgi:hypothetical protein